MKTILTAVLLAVATLSSPAQALDPESPEASLTWRADFGGPSGLPAAYSVSLAYRGNDGPALGLPLFYRSYRLNQLGDSIAPTALDVGFWVVSGVLVGGYVISRANDGGDEAPAGSGAGP